MKVFISFSYADHEWVQEFILHLRELGLDARGWSDGAFAFGADLRDNLLRELRAADIIVPVLTERSIHHANVLFEMGVAKGLGKLIVPVLTAVSGAPASIIPNDLIGQHFIKAESPGEAADALQRSMAKLLVEA